MLSMQPHSTSMLLVVAAVTACAATALAATAANADACSGAGANPWVYNFEVGGHKSKVFNDATDMRPVEFGLFVEDDAVVKRALAKRFLNDSVTGLDNNVLYIDRGGDDILVDVGNGPGDANILGSGVLFEHLQMEGISRSAIKSILLTHGHPDHIGGLVEDLESLEPAFPDAAIYISRIEYEYWTADVIDNGTSLLPEEFISDGIRIAKAILGAVRLLVMMPALMHVRLLEEGVCESTCCKRQYFAELAPAHAQGSVDYRPTKRYTHVRSHVGSVPVAT